MIGCKRLRYQAVALALGHKVTDLLDSFGIKNRFFPSETTDRTDLGYSWDPVGGDGQIHECVDLFQHQSCLSTLHDEL
jgi:hypothetical protein